MAARWMYQPCQRCHTAHEAREAPGRLCAPAQRRPTRTNELLILVPVP